MSVMIIRQSRFRVIRFDQELVNALESELAIPRNIFIRRVSMARHGSQCSQKDREQQSSLDRDQNQSLIKSLHD